jgi:hypothetical protein
MELILVILLLVLFAGAARLGGADSRPEIDDQPRRAI